MDRLRPSKESKLKEILRNKAHEVLEYGCIWDDNESPTIFFVFSDIDKLVEKIITLVLEKITRFDLYNKNFCEEIEEKFETDLNRFIRTLNNKDNAYFMGHEMPITSICAMRATMTIENGKITERIFGTKSGDEKKKYTAEEIKVIFERIRV